MFNVLDLIQRHPWDLAIAATVLAVTVVGAWLVTLTVGSRAGREAREQRRRLEAALNNMKQGLCMFDARDRVVVWNERYLEMYGIPPDQIWPGCELHELLETRRGGGLELIRTD